MSSIDDALKDPEHFLVWWCEPWPGMDHSKNEKLTVVRKVTTVAEAIMIQRYTVFTVLPDTVLTEKELLEAFIAVNFAIITKNKGLPC